MTNTARGGPSQAGAPTRRAPLFLRGDFRLHSGRRSWFKIDVDALSDDELEVLVDLIATVVPPFGVVEGVPRGGLRLAEALGRHAGGPANRLLIVDDVLTTGASMEAQRAGREAYGAVLFSRSRDWPTWITPLFVMMGDPCAPDRTTSGG